MFISYTFFTSLAERGACEPAEEKCLQLLDRHFDGRHLGRLARIDALCPHNNLVQLDARA